MLRRSAICVLVLFVTAVWAAAATFPSVAAVAAYTIDARLDANTKSIDATEVLRYRNVTGQSLDRFPFHLYMNAFQPSSTFIQEMRRDNPGFEWDNKYFGAIEVKSLKASGAGDLTAQMRFVHPDDENRDDKTVAEVRLPRPVPPGGEVEFTIAFHVQLPEVFARAGYKNNFFMVGQWFPKVGVFWRGAWNCHQYHAATEFFADFGTYDVKVTVPANYIVGGVGEQVASTDHGNGTKTVSFHAEAVHDFAWTADPNYRTVESTYSGSAGTTRILMLVQPNHMAQVGRYLDSLKRAMQRFDESYGPYPYPQITVVDPPDEGLRAAGMEYPTLFTTMTTWWMPNGLRIPEDTVVHEYGHEYWYGMVATNEFEEAWLDEGINSYSEAKVMQALYGRDTSLLRWGGATVGIGAIRRHEYLHHRDTDPLTRPGWQFVSESAYNDVSYGKTATVLLTLEGMIGETAMRRALRTYFMRYRFTHPTAEDFLKTVEEVSGKNLRWFFDQAIYGTAVLDYEVASINIDRPDWYKPSASLLQDKNRETVYRSTVTVHRKGDFIFPVTVLVRFDDGSSVREEWDGRDRWTRFTYSAKAKVTSAEVDPDHKVPLDANLFNNSRTAQSNGEASRKLANYWMFLTQLLAQWLAWLV